MEKVVTRIAKARAGDKDIQFWMKKSPQERLKALALLREGHWDILLRGSDRHSIEKRIRRVHRIVRKRKLGTAAALR